MAPRGRAPTVTTAPELAALRAEADRTHAAWQRHDHTCRACQRGDRCARASWLATVADAAGVRLIVAQQQERRS